MAVEHGRPVILTDKVVTSNEWAKRLVGGPGVHLGAKPDEVMEHVRRVLDRESKVDRLLGDILATGQ
jgi:DNA processing protein